MVKHKRRKPRHVCKFQGVSFASKLLQGRIHIDRVPKGDTSRKGNLRTLRAAEGGSGVSERPEAAFGDTFIGVPGVIAGEIDVLPAERRDMLEQGGVEGL